MLNPESARIPLTLDDFHSIESIVSAIAGGFGEWIKAGFTARLTELLRPMNSEQRELIKTLSRRLRIVKYGEYPDCLRKILQSHFNRDRLKSYNNIFAIPIASQGGDSKIKSGSFVAYQMPQIIKRIFGDDLKIHALSGVSYLAPHVNRSRALILLCDDFIGTGQQAQKCLRTYEKYKNDSDDVIFLTIVILKMGYELLKESYPVLYGEIYDRAISDDTALMRAGADRIMREIEGAMKVPGKFSFGFCGAEALLAFELKAPNNTFPVYWYKGRSGRRPLFER